MSSTSEFLNYEETKRIMGELNDIFIDYYKLLTEMDEKIESNFSNGAESALASKLGTKFLSKWNYAALSFEGFKNKFDNYYSKVLKVTKNNEEVENTAVTLAYGLGQLVEEAVSEVVSDVTSFPE